MTEPSSNEADRAERLRQLQARRNDASNGRGRHAAATARPLAAGVTGAAFFLGVAALVSTEPAWLSKSTAAPSTPVTVATTTTTTAPPPEASPPPTTIVVEVVHHPYYVDQFGNPIEPTAGAGGAAPTVAPRAQTSTRPASPPTSGAGTTASPPAAAPAPAPAPPPPPPPPSCSGSKCP